MKLQAAFLTLGFVFSAGASADEVPFSELKSKGATVLTGDELKQLLPGATLRYESSVNNTQLKLAADGTVQGFASPRIGAGAANSGTFDGTWTIEGDRWCVTTRRKLHFCRDVIKVGDKYYTAFANPKNEGRLAAELSVSK